MSDEMDEQLIDRDGMTITYTDASIEIDFAGEGLTPIFMRTMLLMIGNNLEYARDHGEHEIDLIFRRVSMDYGLLADIIEAAKEPVAH